MKMLKYAASVLALATLGMQPAARAQTYPDRPIRLIVPYAAGGGTDVFARTISTRMGQELGQPLVVENRPGAGTIIGAETVARAEPDGYTLLLGDSGTYSVNPSLYKKLPYDPVKDFTPVTLTARFALALVVHPSMPAKTVQEFVDLVRAHPGKYDFASPGAGSPHHLAMEMFRQKAHLQLTHVPYKGNGPALQDLLAGRIPCMFLDLVTIRQHVENGRLRVLAVASTQRLEQLPGVPTIGESVSPGFEAWAWQGLAAPARTPPAVVARINAAYARTVADPDIKRRLHDMSLDLTPGTAEQMAAHVKSEIVKWAAIVKEANITLD